MGKSIETVFRELYNCEFPDTPDSLIIHQELKRKLKGMTIDELEKQRFFTKMNLHECELYSENRALTFGLPIATLIFSVIAILISFGAIQAKGCSTWILASITLLIVFSCLINDCYAYDRKKQAMYHKDKLEIIDSLIAEKTAKTHKGIESQSPPKKRRKLLIKKS